MSQVNQARQSMSSISESYTGPQRLLMGQFNHARQSMSSISESYTGPQRPSWASLTRPGNPCLQFLRPISGLGDNHGPV